VKALQVVGYHQKLRMTDVPVPEATGPYDVVVRIGGAGVCRTDLHILEGQWAEKSGVTLLQAATWVTSAPQQRFGALATKSRSSRSGARSVAGPGT
jgi:NADPH:quinone reductase-like Zn-dependent oxidoreductase